MTLRCKKPRPLTREEKTYRDDRLFIIATEDTYLPDQYFQVFKNPRIKVRVLRTEGGRSAPQHVLQRLTDFVAEFQLMEEDELWLMLDTDHWVQPSHIGNFNSVCAQAIQKGFNLAHSNPCFEIWLLLHVIDLNPNDQFEKCEDVRQRLRELWGECSKRTVDPARFPPTTITAAVRRAENLDNAPEARWPQSTGSHVYKVVKRLLGDDREAGV